jgi:hypothetical protein
MDGGTAHESCTGDLSSPSGTDKSFIFRNITPYRLVYKHQHFVGVFCLQLKGTILKMGVGSLTLKREAESFSETLIPIPRSGCAVLPSVTASPFGRHSYRLYFLLVFSRKTRYMVATNSAPNQGEHFSDIVVRCVV